MPRINESFVKKAPIPLKGVIFHRDDDLTGFALRVSANGSKYYVIDIRIRGRLLRHSIGDAIKGAFGPTGAREAAKALIAKAMQGHDVKAEMLEKNKAETKRKKSEMTMSEATEAYILKRGKNLKERTAKDYRDHMKALGESANKKISAFTREFLEELHRTLEGKTQPNKILQTIRAVLRATIGKSAGSALFEAFPFYRKKAKQSGLEPPQARKLFQILDAMKQPLVPMPEDSIHVSDRKRAMSCVFLQTLLLTGCRPAEISKLKRKDINLDWKTITFPDTKNGEDHKVYMSDTLHSLLLPQLDGLGPEAIVFPSGRNKGNYDPDKTLKKAIELLGAHFTSYDARRVFTIILLGFGVRDTIAKACTNHQEDSRDVHNSVYARPTPDQIKWAFQLVAEYLTDRKIPTMEQEMANSGLLQVETASRG